jgi:hypothetical protein
MDFLKMVLAAFIGQVLVFILVEGFKQSYWGKNCVQEITRIWDSFSKHMTKNKEKK